MNPLVKELRKQLAQTRVDRRGYRLYSEELRHTLCDYAVRRTGQGADFKKIAGELGMSAVTLQNWFKDRELPSKKAGQAVGFRPVEVIGEQVLEGDSPPKKLVVAPATGPSLVLPNGIRIEGLSLAQLTTLLEELGCY